MQREERFNHGSLGRTPITVGNDSDIRAVQIPDYAVCWFLGFSRVDQIPAVLWRADPTANVSIEMSRWLVVVCGLVFFAFFGFADEAQKHYKLAFDSVAKRVGYTYNGTTKIGSGNNSSTGYVFVFITC